MNTLVLSLLVAFGLVCVLADTALAGFKGDLGTQVQWDNGVYPAYKGYGGYGYGGYGYGGFGGPYRGFGGYGYGGPYGGYGGYGYGPFYG